MSMFSVQADSADADQNSRDPGQLHVEVPHWAAQVTLYNGLIERVSTLDDLSESTTSGAYETITTLSPGIYQVEASLAGQIEQQVVTVHSNSVTTLPSDAWSRLSFESASPLTGTASARESHTVPAAKWSRRITWPDAPGGDSRLFLFVRTMAREPASAFSEGLTLLDETGRVVTDFSTGTELDQSAGWMAFTADLPSGFYVLRRVRRGVPRRYQSIYLLSGGETHVFIEATTYPRLMSMTINMAPRGAGFDPDDKAAQAAVLLVDALGRTDSGDLATTEKFAALLDQSPINPWLGIVVAYALLSDADRTQRRKQGTVRRDTRQLLDHVKGLLKAFGDHPDVRAIMLDDGQPPDRPFWHPPLLRVGLGRVQRHATHSASTIPLFSLTDCVLTSLVVNAPWTAWRELERLPIAPPLSSEALGSGKRMFKTRSVPPPGKATRSGINEIGTAPDGAVAWLANSLNLPDTGPAQILSDVFNSFRRSSAPPADSPLAQSAQALGRGSIEQLPDTIPVDFDAMLTTLLDSRAPEEISSATGLPLSRVQAVLDRLHGPEPPPEAETAGPPRQSTARAILSYALQEVARPRNDALETATPESMVQMDDSVSYDLPVQEPPAQPTMTRLDELIVTIQAEADRLALADDDKSDTWSQSALDHLQRVVSRLDTLTQEMLRYAEIVAVTDMSGRVLEGNGAWRALVSSDADRARRRDLAQQESPAKPSEQEAWESALASVSGSRGTITAPASNQISPSWDIQRSAIKDMTANQDRAFINVLRAPGSASLPADPGRVSSLVDELKLSASLCAYGSPERRTEYIGKVDSVTSKLEQAIGGG